MNLLCLVHLGLDSNTCNHEGLTALHQCCIDGHGGMAALLLLHGASVNVKDKDGWTPLHAAATCGHIDIVKLLVQQGANLLAVNGDGDMPFDITEDEDTLLFIEEAMTKQAITHDMVNAKRDELREVLMRDVQSLINEKESLDLPVNEDGATLLHVAIVNDYNDVVKLLLNNGASDTVQDVEGWRAIHAAAFWNNHQAVELLVDIKQTDLRAVTDTGLMPFEMCDDVTLRNRILEIISGNEQKNAVITQRRNSKSSEEDDDFQGISTLKFIEGNTVDETDDESKTEGLQQIDETQKILTVTNSTILPSFNRVESISKKRNSIREAKNKAPMKRYGQTIKYNDVEDIYDNSYDLMLTKPKKDIVKHKTEPTATILDDETKETSAEAEELAKTVSTTARAGELSKTVSTSARAEELAKTVSTSARAEELAKTVSTSARAEELAIVSKKQHDIEKEKEDKFTNLQSTYGEIEELNVAKSTNNKQVSEADVSIKIITRGNSSSAEIVVSPQKSLDTSSNLQESDTAVETTDMNDIAKSLSTKNVNVETTNLHVNEQKSTINYKENFNLPPPPTYQESEAAKDNENKMKENLVSPKTSPRTVFNNITYIQPSIKPRKKVKAPDPKTNTQKTSSPNESALIITKTTAPLQPREAPEMPRPASAPHHGNGKQSTFKNSLHKTKQTTSIPKEIDSVVSNSHKISKSEAPQEIVKSKSHTSPKSEAPQEIVKSNSHTSPKSEAILPSANPNTLESRAESIIPVKPQVPLRRKRFDPLQDTGRPKSLHSPPQGSLQDLKLQRQRSRQDIAIDLNETYDERYIGPPAATRSYSYQPPPSPTRVRHVFKQPKAEFVSPTITYSRQRCCIM